VKTGIVRLSEIARMPGLILSADRYLLTDEEVRQALLAKMDARIKPLLAEWAAIAAADGPDLRRRYAFRFWHLRGK
jgi:hypothetical protein